ncbi:MAG: NINE protein [Gammaproteobacteria bacterium]
MKSVVRAYYAAVFGLVFGIIGRHRFYLGFFKTGALMSVLFLAGVGCLATGYAGVLQPLFAAFSATSGGGFPAEGILNLDSQKWLAIGAILCAVSLCWLVVDLLLMSVLVRRANKLQKS